MKDFVCPLCHNPLHINSDGLNCCNRHQFDRAREGYFNLLPVHHKSSREPGDAKEQLRARRDFLLAGFFNPLIHGLLQHFPASTKSVLDIGCGEGFFTGAFADALPEADIYGIDIAKEGVRLAAKDHRGFYAVASSYALPIANASMDVITRIYAPSQDEELQRVLGVDGRVIIVTPGQQHLINLRRQIYPILRPHPEPQTPNGFVELERSNITFSLSLPAGHLTEALLQMTPLAWRLGDEQKMALIDAGIEDQADFNLAVYGRS